MLFLLLLCFLTLLYLYTAKLYQHWKKLKVPYDKPLLFFGNLAPFIFRQKSIAHWSQDTYNSYTSRYIGFFLFFKRALMIRDLDLIKQLIIKDCDIFLNHRNLICEELDPFLSRNLFRLRDKKWRHMRQTLSRFFTGRKLRSSFLLICECAEEFTNYFLNNKINKPVILEMKDTFSKFLSDVVAATVFGYKFNFLEDCNNSFYAMGKSLCEFGNTRRFKFFGYNISLSLMRFFKINLLKKEVSNFFHNLALNNIATRKKECIVKMDLINLLMEIQVQRQEKKNNCKVADKEFTFELTDEDITAQLMLFFIGGADTTNSALCHMAYELALNPSIQEHLQEEVDDTFQKVDGKITYEAILEMKYLNTVVSEVLRKWPPVMFIERECTKSYTIPPDYPDELPVNLEVGDLIWIPIFAIHRDPNYYPNPEKFDPERFNDENKGGIKPMAYLPFGFGPRNCIGIRYALLEIKAIFLYLLSKFTLVVVKQTQIPLKPNKFQFILYPEGGLWLGLKLRDNK